MSCLAGGRRVPVEVLGRDPGNDLALLKVEVPGGPTTCGAAGRLVAGPTG